MQPDRLSALDLAFLDLETPRAPLHVGWTMRFVGPPPPLAALRRQLGSRLGSVPRFRRVIARAPLGLGGPHWVDDPRFDVARHVHAVMLPAPGGAAELRGAASVLLAAPLERDRPLWQVHLVGGLRDGGFALVCQAHHALVDGIAAIEVAMLLFDVPGRPEAAAGAQPEWTPVDPPSLPAHLRSTAAVARAAGAVPAAAARVLAGPRPVSLLRDLARAAESVSAPAPATALDRSMTGERALAFAQASLDAARDTGRRHGATVNDVLLAATALALRAALRRRGEAPDHLKVLVPVSLRAAGTAAELGNRISFLAVDLPLSETDPARVLALVRARTRARKAGDDAGPLAALARGADALPAPARRALVRGAARLASFNAVVSNVPGPPVELTLLGRPLLALHPMVPLLDGHALTVGAISYRSRLNVGVCADAVVVPDAVQVARDIEAAFDALALAPGTVAPPWRTLARARRAELRPVGDRRR